jgi:uncharacterized protein YigA (DUF484 family)
MLATMEQLEPRTEALLDRLCVYFDAELERQENVLAICRAHGDAAKALDVDVIDKRTEALALVLAEAARAERERIEIVRALTESISDEPQAWSLSALIATVPNPWRRRLAEAQVRIRETVAESQTTIASNAYVMRRALRTVNGAIDTVLGPANAASYTPAGESPETQTRQAALLNTQG